jgi:hypothetical protein
MPTEKQEYMKYWKQFDIMNANLAWSLGLKRVIILPGSFNV